MIIEDYVPFKIAKLLKEKGFDEKCHRYWQYDKANDKDDVDGICLCCCDGVFELNNSELDTLFEESLLNFGYSAPTLQMAMKWLREVHNIFISIVCCTYPTSKKATWTPEITTFESVFPCSAVECDTYEQACESAIKYCLENLI